MDIWMKCFFFIIALPAVCLAQSPAPANKANRQTGEQTAAVRADRFPGADMCVRIQAAEAASHGQMIDARHFEGAQACSVDPLANLVSDQAIRFGQVTVNAATAWALPQTANGVSVIGAGIGQTRFHYTGPSIPSFISITGQPGGSFGDNLEELSILGDNNATNGLAIYGTHHNMLKHLGCWGFTNCLTSTASILNTWIKPVVSIADAGWQWGYSKPASFAPRNGLYLSGDKVAGQGIIQSTAATIVDALIENVSGCGIDLVSAATATITSGTSEGNGTGLCIAAGSNDNTVIGLDMESNTVQDVTDAGNSNRYVNVIAISNGKNAIEFTGNASDWVIEGGTIAKVLNSAVYPAWVAYQGASVACQAGFLCSASSGVVVVKTARSGNTVGDLFQGVWAAAAPEARVCLLEEMDSDPVQVGIHQNPAIASGVLFQAAVLKAPSSGAVYQFAYQCKP
jgi:hypothetical protein